MVQTLHLVILEHRVFQVIPARLVIMVKMGLQATLVYQVTLVKTVRLVIPVLVVTQVLVAIKASLEYLALPVLMEIQAIAV